MVVGRPTLLFVAVLVGVVLALKYGLNWLVVVLVAIPWVLFFWRRYRR